MVDSVISKFLLQVMCFALLISYSFLGEGVTSSDISTDFPNYRNPIWLDKIPDDEKLNKNLFVIP